MDEFAPLIHFTQRVANRIRDVQGHMKKSEKIREVIQSSIGYDIALDRWRPKGVENKLPALLICPDDQEGKESIPPAWISVMVNKGIEVWAFDPAGRGESWGTEDHGGAEHQDNVVCLLKKMNEETNKIAILSMGQGSAMAMGGAIAAKVPLAGLIDYEGPSRSNEPSTGLSKRHPIDLLKELPCPYIRLQSINDHSVGQNLRHCREILRVAQKSPDLVFQLNHHPFNKVPPRPQWLLPGSSSARRAMIQKAVQLLL